jgi:hypothetical protein
MGKVAAIQMTSGHVVPDNLAVAGKYLREAKELGADIACLPENFSFIGLKDADKVQAAEADGVGPIQEFLRDTARELKMWILAGTTVIKGDSPTRVANTSLLIDAHGKRVARYDKIHLFDVDIPGRDERYLESKHVTAGRKAVVADTPVGKLGLVRVLRHAFSGAVPGSGGPGRRVAGHAGRLHGADRAGALGNAAAGARHRESYVTWWPRRSGARIRAAARLMAIR